MIDRQKRLRLVFWLIAIGAILLLITYLSGQVVQESDALSKSVTRQFMDFFFRGYTREELRRANHLMRKAAHFTLYAALGFSLTGALQYQSRAPKLPAAILLGAVFAALDEFHQHFVAGRGPQASDVLLDTCGVATGSLLMLGILLLRAKLCRSTNMARH